MDFREVIEAGELDNYRVEVMIYLLERVAALDAQFGLTSVKPAADKQ